MKWTPTSPSDDSELAAISAVDLLDDTSMEQLTTDWIDRARQSGALARLAAGLAFRGRSG